MKETEEEKRLWQVALGNEVGEKIPDLIPEYVELHKNDKGYGNGACYWKKVDEWIKKHAVKSVLDYGCGKFKTGLRLRREGFDTVGYDPAMPEFSLFPSRSFDGAYCLDVLEHIPAADLRMFMLHMSCRVDETLLINVCTRTAVFKLPSGRNCHETVCSADWWRRAIETFIPNFEIVDEEIKSDHCFFTLTARKS